MSEQDDAGLGSLEKVRDILVGAQMREVAKKLSAFEDAMERRIVRMRDDFKKTVSALEISTKKELSALTEKLKTQRREDVARTKSLESTVMARIGNVEDASGSAVQGLRDEMAGSIGAMTDELRSELEESKTKSGKDIGELRDAKVGRNDLAALLVEVAGRLNGESSRRRRGQR